MDAEAPEAANSGQVAYWNEQAGPRWVRFQDELDAQLEGLGFEALEGAAIGSGDRVLDVGCGCGATSLEAAARATREGSVVGVDLSEPMLAHARTRAGAAGATRLSFLRADAQTHPFEPGSFDAVVSRFGVMFFDAPEAAFANLRRALAPGGRLSFVCWQELPRNIWMAVPMAAVARHLTLPAPPAPGSPGPFAFADPERVRKIVEAGGFDAVRVEPLEGNLAPAGADTAADAASMLIEIGPASHALREAGADEALRAKVARAAADALAPFVSDAGVQAPYAAWRVTARA